MRAATVPPISKTKRIFAGLLAAWMSGVIFLLCCGTMNAQAAEIESCPLAKKRHCAKSSGDENAGQLESFQTGDAAFDCCGFLPQVFDKARKLERSEKSAEAPNKTQIKPPSFNSVKIQPNAFFQYRPRPLNRSGTYLKNRVFRI